MIAKKFKTAKVIKSIPKIVMKKKNLEIVKIEINLRVTNLLKIEN